MGNVSLAERIVTIKRYERMLSERELDPLAQSRVVFGIMETIARASVQSHASEQEGVVFCRSHGFQDWVEKWLDNPESDPHPSMFGLEPIITLATDKEVSHRFVERMNDSQLPSTYAVKLYAQGRLAQVKGCSWDFEYPKYTLPLFDTYLELIRAVCNGEEITSVVRRVEEGFKTRHQIEISEDSGLYGSKDIPIQWDHLKAVILSASSR